MTFHYSDCFWNRDPYNGSLQSLFRKRGSIAPYIKQPTRDSWKKNSSKFPSLLHQSTPLRIHFSHFSIPRKCIITPKKKDHEIKYPIPPTNKLSSLAMGVEWGHSKWGTSVHLLICSVSSSWVVPTNPNKAMPMPGISRIRTIPIRPKNKMCVFLEH